MNFERERERERESGQGCEERGKRIEGKQFSLGIFDQRNGRI